MIVDQKTALDKSLQTLQFAAGSLASSAFHIAPGNGPFRGNSAMALSNKIIAEAIDTAPLNRGLKGADWLAHEGNVPVTFDNGDVVLFDNEGGGIYAIHVLFKGRGRTAIEHAREAIGRMFAEHGAALIMGMVPDFRRDVKLLARWTGMHSAGPRFAPEGVGMPYVEFELFVLSKFQWKVAKK